MKSIKIGSKLVSNFSEPLIIAEVGANFNGDLDIAKKMILEAKRVGVDVVKFQCWSKDNIMATKLWKNKEAELKSFGHSSQEELLDFLSLNHENHKILSEYCKEVGIMFASTPHSFSDVDFLDELNVPFYKIASMDLNHLSFIEYVAKKGKPIIFSTGMGDNEEIAKAVECIKGTGNNKVILLHCCSLYPPEEGEFNLNNMDTFRKKFQLIVGFSDHSKDLTVPLASIARGAAVIEKHFTLDKDMEGWDHAVSATPEEFKTLVYESKRVVKALGNKERILGDREKANRQNFRRSIVVAKNLSKGTIIEYEDLDFKRPPSGLQSDEYNKILGKKLNKDLKYDDQITLDDVG